jgi:hypothetical protein
MPLANIINKSLMSSTYPDVWKLAEVIQLLKEGDREVASNQGCRKLLRARGAIG